MDAQKFQHQSCIWSQQTLGLSFSLYENKVDYNMQAITKCIHYTVHTSARPIIPKFRQLQVLAVAAGSNFQTPRTYPKEVGVA